MRIENCYFCSGKIYPGHGVQFVRNDCKVFKFCRPKCHHSFKKKKNPRKVRWTKTFRKSAGKELAIDPTFEFEKRRNIPVKYNRELWQKTVDAIKKISDIRTKREGAYIQRRLEVGKHIDLQEAKALTEKHMHLIRLPAADIKKSKVKVKEEEVKMEDEIVEKLNASTSKIVEKKKTKEVKKVMDDSDIIEEDYSDDSYDSDDDDDSDDDSEMSGLDDGSIMEEVPLEAA